MFIGSEDEIEHEKDKKTPESVKRQNEASGENTPIKMPKLEKGFTKLVSYGEGGEEGEDSVEEPSSPESDTRPDKPYSPGTASTESYQKLAGDVELPPSPPGNCSRSLQEKVTKMYERKSQTSLNTSIQQQKQFRNPSIYDKLIDFCRIDEKGTNYPPHLFNPSIWGKESYYEALAKAQKEEMEKREKEKKERTKVEFVVATKKSSSSNDLSSKSGHSNVKQERKSKWDLDKAASRSSSSSKPSTTISSVGSLKKQK